MLHTIIRDRTTSRDDFIFYSQRLFRIIIEEALSHFEFVHTTVETPTTSKLVFLKKILKRFQEKKTENK